MHTKKGPWAKWQEYRLGKRQTNKATPMPYSIGKPGLMKKIRAWNWKWITMMVIGLVGVIIAGVVAHHQITATKITHSKIGWSYDYPEKAYPGAQVQRRGYIQIKEGSHDRKLLFGIGTCEIVDNGQKFTVQASIRENAKFPSEIGLPVEDKCSTATYRYHIFKCCWID